jgi:predicted HAD superfamily Cof-like phosphohydrolase
MGIPTRYLTEHGRANALFMQKIVEARRSVGITTPDLPSRPTLPAETTRLLRAKLILEEAIETINSLGFSIDIPFTSRDLDGTDSQTIYGGTIGEIIDVGIDEINLVPRFEPDLVEIVDGCADISVVTVGTLIACGVGDKPILEEVDANNMKKFGEGHAIREDGKLVKPANHVKPDFEKLIDAQGKYDYTRSLEDPDA